MIRRYLYIPFAFLLLLFSCRQPAGQLSRPAVTVSILPERYFVEKIAGDLLDVNVMIPPGASPVTYEPSPLQMNKLGSSDLYLKIGRLVFEENWSGKFAEINPSLQIHDLSQGITFISGIEEKPAHKAHHHDEDPHIWMSPKNVRIISENIMRVLTAAYPADSALFYRNQQAFIREIDAIDSLYRSHADRLQGKAFLVYHPALTYLARDYGMDQVVLEYEGKEPPPAHIREVIDASRARNIRSIFVQEQFNPDNAKTLASEIGARIIMFDPLSEDWAHEMKYILEKLTGENEI